MVRRGGGQNVVRFAIDGSDDEDNIDSGVADNGSREDGDTQTTDESSVDSSTGYFEFSDEDQKLIDGAYCEPETLEEILERINPDVKASDWSQLPLHHEDIQATVGVALHEGLDKCLTEVGAIRTMLCERLGTQRVTEDLLFNEFWGINSRAFRVLTEAKIFDSSEAGHIKFMSFLATFLTCSLFQISSSQLFKTNMIDKKGLMTKDEFNAVWKKLGESGLPPAADRNKTHTPSYVPLWMKIERSDNELYREMFVTGLGLNQCEIVIDDDKNHFDRGFNSYHCGLALKRHVVDNRKGNTLHTAVRSYSQVIVGLAFERVWGDNAAAASKRILHDAFTPSAAGETLGDMSAVGVAQDRGYMEKKLTCEVMLPVGTHIPVSTLKRMAWLPCTYDQAISSETDERVEISTKGGKTMWIYMSVISDRNVYVVVYRNGNGGVVLALSTAYHLPEWDFVPLYPPDMKLYREWCEAEQHLMDESMLSEEDESQGSVRSSRADEILKEKFRWCFNQLDPATGKFGVASDEIISLLIEKELVPLTRTQRTQCWFFLRQFSLTSSTTDKILLLLEGNLKDTFDRDAWELVFGVIRSAIPLDEEDTEDQEGSLHPENEAPLDLGDDGEESESTRSETDSTDGDAPLANNSSGDTADEGDINADEGGSSNGTVEAEYTDMIGGILPTLEELKTDAPGKRQDLLNRLTGPEANLAVPVNYVEYILRRLGAEEEFNKLKDPALDKKARNLLLSWVRSPETLRPHFFLSAAELKKIGRHLDCHGAVAKKRNPGPIREALIAHLEANPELSIPASQEQFEGQEAAPTRTPRQLQRAALEELSTDEKVYVAIIESAYLKPLGTAAKGHARRGQELEAPIIMAFLRDQEGANAPCKYGYKLSHVCDAGLVQKSKEERHIKGSIDFIAIGTARRSGRKLLVGIEIKARMTNKTQQAEEDHFREVKIYFQSKSAGSRNRLVSGRDQKYFACSADSNEFGYLVKETHEVCQLLHHGVALSLEKVLLLIGDRRGEVMFGVLVSISEEVRNAYGKVLFDIREHYLGFVYDDEGLDESTQEELSKVCEHVRLRKNGSLEDADFFHMLGLYRDASHMVFPLPTIKMIIPAALAIWNVLKGGSDSITKNLDGNEYSIPTSDNQSDAIARLLMLKVYQFMRCVQVKGAKRDLSFYKSVRNYRKAASARCTFFDAIQISVNQAKTRVIAASSTVATTPVRASSAPVSAARRQGASATRSFLDVALESLTMSTYQTGSTPKQNVRDRYEDLKNKRDNNIPLTLRSKKVLTRTETCTGHFSKLCSPTGGKASGKKCGVCGADTIYYCFGCKRHLCIHLSKNAKALVADDVLDGFNKIIKITTKDQNGKEVVRYYEGSCWQYAHMQNNLEMHQDNVQKQLFN